MHAEPQDLAAPRQAERHPAVWRGQVFVAVGSAPCMCVVKDFSVSGAMLEFSGVTPQVDAFNLVLSSLDLAIECRVTRRRDSEIGVSFGRATSLADRASEPASGTTDEGGQRAEIGRLQTILADIAEFTHCGFEATLAECGTSVVISRDGNARGAWTTGPTGLIWVSSSASEPLTATDAADAARISLLMVLNMLRVRRAKAAHDRSLNDARVSIGLSRRR